MPDGFFINQTRRSIYDILTLQAGTRPGVVGLERTLNEVIIKRNDMILSGGRGEGCGVNNTILVTLPLIIINL